MGKRFGKIPFLPITAAGFLLGILMGVWNGGKGSVLDVESLCAVKDLEVQKPAFFFEILKERGGAACLILLGGTTYLAPAICILSAMWIGMCAGMFLTISIVQYGIKGILLLPAATLPQFLLYLPAFYFLLRWCERLYGAIYRRKTWEKWTAMAGLILIMAAMAVGCFMEYQIGPRMLKTVLDAF